MMAMNEIQDLNLNSSNCKQHSIKSIENSCYFPFVILFQC